MGLPREQRTPGAPCEWYFRKYQNGRVYWDPQYGARGVSGAIDAYYATQRDSLGFPADDEEAAPSSPYGTSGIRQSFAGGRIYSSKLGIYLVKNHFCDVHESEGGTAGWLGFPVADFSTSRLNPDPQSFEGGAIYETCGSGGGWFAVRREVERALQRNFRHNPSSFFIFSRYRIHIYPTSKETPTGVSAYGTSGSVQNFATKGATLARSLLLVGSAAALSERLAERSFEPYYLTVPLSVKYGAVVIPQNVLEYYRGMGAEASWLGFPVDPGNPLTILGL